MTSAEKWQDAKEKGIVMGTFVFIFLPVRLVFYELVSDAWIGSFGVVLGLSLGLLYACRRGYLGRFGRIWNRQIVAISRGAIGKLLFWQAIFFLIYWGGSIYFVEVGMNDYGTDLAYMLDDVGGGIEITGDADDLAFFEIAARSEGGEVQAGWDSMNDGLGRLMSDPATFLDPAELYFAFALIFATINLLLGGWWLHFSTVLLVEQIEQLGIITYFRYFYRPRRDPGYMYDDTAQYDSPLGGIYGYDRIAILEGTCPYEAWHENERHLAAVIGISPTRFGLPGSSSAWPERAS